MRDGCATASELLFMNVQTSEEPHKTTDSHPRSCEHCSVCDHSDHTLRAVGDHMLVGDKMRMFVCLTFPHIPLVFEP